METIELMKPKKAEEKANKQLQTQKESLQNWKPQNKAQAMTMIAQVKVYSSVVKDLKKSAEHYLDVHCKHCNNHIDEELGIETIKVTTVPKIFTDSKILELEKEIKELQTKLKTLKTIAEAEGRYEEGEETHYWKAKI